MSKTLENKSVGSLVTERPGRAEVLERHGIDYCCGGGKTLAEACDQADTDLARVTAELAASDEAGIGEAPPGWEAMSMTQLADHIVATHHHYLEGALPRIGGLIQKVVKAHGFKHPELAELQEFYATYMTSLGRHMAKEEQVLFPMLRDMEGPGGGGPSHCGSVRNPISAMELEHDEAGEGLRHMRRLTADYVPPEGACNTYRVMLHSLEELEQDMHRHVHLENNVLFPRAIDAQARAGAEA